MAANVETMFSVREKPWHKLGTIVDKAPTSADALKLAGLDWNVESREVYDKAGNVIPSFFANTRDSDEKVLGIVGAKYKIVQNKEAFEFTDALIGEGITYETAGSLKEGKTIWLLGKMPERYIVGDKFEPYICFTNTHDGTGAVRVCMTPIRVVCNNTLNLALSGATRNWSAVHSTNIDKKLNEARLTLLLANEYLAKLDEEADKLANEKMSEGEMRDTLKKIFDVDSNASKRQKENSEIIQEQIMICTLSPDLIKFANTKWGFINAVSDWVDHSEPLRHTKNYNENRWGNIIGGNSVLDKALALV